MFSDTRSWNLLVKLFTVTQSVLSSLSPSSPPSSFSHYSIFYSWALLQTFQSTCHIVPTCNFIDYQHVHILQFIVSFNLSHHSVDPPPPPPPLFQTFTCINCKHWDTIRSPCVNQTSVRNGITNMRSNLLVTRFIIAVSYTMSQKWQTYFGLQTTKILHTSHSWSFVSILEIDYRVTKRFGCTTLRFPITLGTVPPMVFTDVLCYFSGRRIR